jgi:DNA-binding response OmpR family regulator
MSTPQPERRRILVVEDDSASAELITEMLAKRWEIVVAPTAAEALKRFDERRPDVLVLDLHLSKDGDGIDVFQQVRRRIGHAPRAILVSSADELEDTARALHIPVMRKPLRQSPLVALVERVLATGSS